MEIENYIIRRVNAILQATDTRIVERLKGGMSNYTYVVECKGEKYTYRVPGKFAERFVNRFEEFDNIKAIDSLDINNETVYMEVATGEKLARYVSGIILSTTDIVSYNGISARTLKKLHESNVVLSDYDAFGRIGNYERYCRDFGFSHPQKYLVLREKLDELHKHFENIEKVPCHCDYQPTNLVISGKKLFVLDWEFAGMNDPFYDIACYGNAGFDKALSLLEAYVGHNPTDEEIRRLKFHRAFQCLQWFNVAIFKDKIGLSKDLNTDFNAVAMMFLGMAEELIG
ncbi:MAG: phosphotransferase [Candidatus Limimorpha sp.]